jgi:hypothetical protein
MFRKACITLAVAAALASTLAVASGSAQGASFANAGLCIYGGWHGLMRPNGTAFQSQFHCVQWAAFGGTIYAQAGISVELCGNQPADGISVCTEGFGLQPTTPMTTTLTKNAGFLKFITTFVQPDGTASSSTGHINAPCVTGNVYSASATGTSADSLSVPTVPGIPITSNTVSRTSSCP